MPRKEIVRTCKDIGKQLAKECNNGGSVDVKRVSEILTERIGSKKASKIVVADDFDTFKRYTDSLGFDENLAKYFFDGSKSAVLSNPKDKSILLSLRINSMTTAEALNTTSHELEHTLYKAISPKSFLGIKKKETKIKLDLSNAKEVEISEADLPENIRGKI